ncbi:MAG: hypothetical protein DWQ02_12310 [Bacteroidetes bacterium]|nr:MAG: hypothetical protein DWQ02_12310 [Bacteroidota bacterium]
MPNNEHGTTSGFLDFPLYDLVEEGELTLNFHGQGEKKVMVIAKGENVENEIEFLQSVLSPLGVQYPNDPFILITGDQRVSFNQLIQKFEFDSLISMGISPDALGLQINAPLYYPINIANKQLIFTETITVFTAEKEKGGARPKAKQLWLSLKSFFENE